MASWMASSSLDGGRARRASWGAFGTLSTPARHSGTRAASALAATPTSTLSSPQVSYSISPQALAPPTTCTLQWYSSSAKGIPYPLELSYRCPVCSHMGAAGGLARSSCLPSRRRGLASGEGGMCGRRTFRPTARNITYYLR